MIKWDMDGLWRRHTQATRRHISEEWRANKNPPIVFPPLVVSVHLGWQTHQPAGSQGLPLLVDEIPAGAAWLEFSTVKTWCQNRSFGLKLAGTADKEGCWVEIGLAAPQNPTYSPYTSDTNEPPTTLSNDESVKCFMSKIRNLCPKGCE